MIRKVLVGLMLSLSFCLGAQTTKEIIDLQNIRKKALESIEATNRLITSTRKNTMSLLNRLNLLNAEIKTRKEVISVLNREIAAIDREQRRINSEVKRLSDDLDRKKQNYASAVQGMYASRAARNELMFILSASTFSQSYNRMRYLREYSAWRKEQAQEIVARQTELNAKKEELARTRRAKEGLIAERQQEASNLKSQEEKQQEAVRELKKKEKTLKAELARHQKQADALNRKIEQLIAEEARKAAAKKNAERKEKGGYSMTKAERQLSDNFEQNKGKLPFPLTGNYVIVGRFGQQQHQELKYVKTNNNGIDLQTQPGTGARAVFNGVVTKVFVVPGYNSSVIIRHGNYLTVYSNLSEVYVKAGDKVSTRQAIGKIYSDPEDGNRTILHFQIWKETTKINPELWLDK